MTPDEEACILWMIKVQLRNADKALDKDDMRLAERYLEQANRWRDKLAWYSSQ